MKRHLRPFVLDGIRGVDAKDGQRAMIFSPRGRHRPTRVLLSLSVLLLAVYALVCRLLPALHYRAFQLYAHANFDPRTHPHRPAYESNFTVNLVVATRSPDNIAWTNKIAGLIPNLNVVRYVSDSSTAEFHPAVLNKGREALNYFSYIYDFYDSLPDISIFVHSHEHAWHIDSALRGSMPFALAQLDLDQVSKRGYYNLRPSWGGACPAWINTTKTPEEGHVKEEGYVATAFRDNFGKDVEVPEIMAGPCCSQFAVSRDTIRKVSKDQYKHHIDWMVEMSDKWGDSLTGRTWEHLWPYLFMQQAKDCLVERDSFCRMYHICFKDTIELASYQKVWEERAALRETLAGLDAFIADVVGYQWVKQRKRRLTDMDAELEKGLQEALRRGIDPQTRIDSTRNLRW